MKKPSINVIVGGRSQSVAAPCEFSTVILKSHISPIDQMTQENTKYVIRWNYDLEGQSLAIPTGCILEFDGGKLMNGTIEWNNAKVVNRYAYNILENIEEQGNKVLLEGITKTTEVNE